MNRLLQIDTIETNGVIEAIERALGGPTIDPALRHASYQWRKLACGRSFLPLVTDQHFAEALRGA